MTDLKSAPSWLNQEYFQEILTKEYDIFKINKFTANEALEKGENYASTIYSVKITVELKDGNIEEKSYMVKASPEGNIIQQMFKDINLFKTEFETFEYVLPAFEQLYKEAGVNIAFGPKYLKATSEPTAFVMDDLKARNYRNEDRFTGLDLCHTEAALKKLAQFHAASVCLREKRGPYSEVLQNGIFNEQMKEFFEYINKINMSTFVQCIHLYGVDEKYVEKLKKLNETLTDKFMVFLSTDPNGFNVLNHGDFWMNNIMFQHDEDNNIKDVLFVDFQSPKYGPPMQDLYHLIMSSTIEEIKVSKFDYMIRFYYDELVKSLKLLNYSKTIPKLVDLHCQLLQSGFLAVQDVIGMVPIVLMEKSENASFEIMFQDNEVSREIRRKMYSNEKYIRIIKEVLPFFENKGFLD